MAIPIHLTESDYTKAFPPDLDEFPTVINEQHYIDAWLLNSVFNSLLETEQYLIDWKSNIEAPLGDDILGDDGSLIIAIPPARYPMYKFAEAWDSNLLEENIKEGEIIFGVTGALAAGGGGIGVSVPGFSVLLDAVVYIDLPDLSLNASKPAISVPTLTVA